MWMTRIARMCADETQECREECVMKNADGMGESVLNP